AGRGVSELVDLLLELSQPRLAVHLGRLGFAKRGILRLRLALELRLERLVQRLALGDALLQVADGALVRFGSRPRRRALRPFVLEGRADRIELERFGLELGLDRLELAAEG